MPRVEMGCPGERWGARGRDGVPGGEMGCPGERWEVLPAGDLEDLCWHSNWSLHSQVFLFGTLNQVSTH